LLDSFVATGSDGNSYKVCAYERLVPVPGSAEHWEPSGQIEYRLEDGRLLEARSASARVVGSELTLGSEKF
jgi:hypothetical protein